MSELPDGWVSAQIGSICTLNNGRAFKPLDWGSSGLPIVRIQNLNNPSATFNYFDGEFDAKHHLKGGELLFAWSGTPGTSFGAHVWRGGEAVLNQHIFRVDFDEKLLDKRFLRHAINQTLDHLIDIAHGGVGLRHVTKGKFENTSIRLPPKAEQKRIADKLDSVLARVDACRDRLDRIPALLKRFRQSVLNAATSGELSADWRASEALHGWAPVMIKEICVSISDGDHQAPPQVDQGISFITISAFSSGRLDLNKATRCVPQSYFEQLKPMRRPSLGDVLYSVTGSIGISALVDTDRPFAFQRHVALLKPDLSRVSSAYLRYLLGSDGVRRQAADVATGSAQLTIPLNGLRAFNALLPCLAEQHEIVRRVETLFAFAGRLEARCAAARKQAGQLTPALLAKAFRGELVPQDPADEPAAELLKRLAARRADAPKARRGKARASTGV